MSYKKTQKGISMNWGIKLIKEAEIMRKANKNFEAEGLSI